MGVKSNDKLVMDNNFIVTTPEHPLIKSAINFLNFSCENKYDPSLPIKSNFPIDDTVSILFGKDFNSFFFKDPQR